METFRPVKSLRVDGDTFYAWQEAIEREVSLPATDVDLLSRHPVLHPFELSSQTTEEALRDHQLQTAGRIVRTQQAIEGSLSVAAHSVAENIFKITVQVKNFTTIDEGRQPRLCSAALAGFGARCLGSRGR